MILKVSPTKKLKGSIQLPGSKSYSIRAIIVAACGGSSELKFPSDCDDALVALSTAKTLGCTVKKLKDGTIKIKSAKKKAAPRKINVNESGTVLRLILPLASLYSQKVEITGKGTLFGRPNDFLTKTLRSMGLDVKGTGPKEGIPIKISGGALEPGDIHIDGSISSQFISALLITTPQLSNDSFLTITGDNIVSLDYIIMTLNVLKRAGVDIIMDGSQKFVIKGNQKFCGLKKFHVPSDLGLAAFMLAGAALIDSDIELKAHLSNDLIQADGHILPLLEAMGVEVELTKKSLKVKGPFQLHGGTFSLKNCPDLVPIMAVLALFARGTTRLTDIAHARVKESNRITDLRKELLKIGADIKEKHNELIINPKEKYKSGRTLDPHKDHRMAMAFSILGLKIGVRVKDAQCVSKSYPAFIKDLKALKGKATRA